jgi:hypothetical protein
MEFPKSIIDSSDYDEIMEFKNGKNIETKGFTENLDKIHIMDQDNPFFVYLKGFMHNISEYEIFHAYYHNENKNIKFYVSRYTTPIAKSGIYEA